MAQSPIIRRSLIFLSCTFLGLICGTLYLYSSYSPQFAKRVGYNVTESSSIAFAGTIGIAIAGPIAGTVVDKTGFTRSLLTGGLLLLAGYFFLKLQFDRAVSLVFLSCIFLFSIGVGSTFINSACLKCCAITFPSIRGVATSMPLALYGLSALFYSSMASIFFPGKVSEFLGFILISCMIIFAVCSPCIIMCDREQPMRTPANIVSMDAIEMNTLSTMTSPGTPRSRFFKRSFEQENQIAGIALLRSPRFWIIFLITGLLASLGQTYIYSVGYMVNALVIHQLKVASTSLTERDELNLEAVIQNSQQLQVGLLSIANCVGRLAAGVMGDIIVHSFHLSREWLLLLPSVGFLVTQIIAGQVSTYEGLSSVSVMTGLFYGYSFCIVPIIVGDTFGMDNFSSNWGIVGLSPIIPSFLFTRLFGVIYDSNSIKSGSEGSASCIIGNKCYISIYKLTTCVTIFVIILVLVLNFTHKKLRTKSSMGLHDS